MDMDIKTDNIVKTAKKEKQPVNKKRFWKIFGAYLAVMLLCGIVGLRMFYDYTSEYEKTRPDNMMQKVVSGFDTGILKQLLSDEFAGKVSEYESLDRAIKKVLIPAIGSEYSFRKLAKEYTAEKPVYTVLSNDREVAKITLAPSEQESRFGLHQWTVESAELLIDLSDVHTFEFTLRVPQGMTVTINGKGLDPSLVVSSKLAENAKFESDPSVAPMVDVYKLDGFLTVPFVRALDQDSVEYASVYTDTECDVVCPEEMSHTVKITAPSDAIVTVGNSRVGEDQITNSDIMYENAEGFNAAFRMTEYTVKGLLSEPYVSVISTLGDDLEMTTVGEDTYIFTLPKDKLHTVSIKVPSAIETEIKVNGILLTDEWLSSSETAPEYPQLSEISGFIKGEIHPTEYVISGLYETPTVEVTAKNGVELVQYKTSNPDEFVYTPPYDQTLSEKYDSVVEKFVSAYINYTANGGTNTMANFAKVNACLLANSQAYTEMHNTIYSFSQNFQFKVVSQTITTSDYQSWGDSCFSCTAKYDVILSRWRNIEDSGTMKLYFVRYGGAWLLAKINI